MLEDLMQPEDEARNEHKRVQLRELASLNGTLKVHTPPVTSAAVSLPYLTAQGRYRRRGVQ